jgi:glycosyltransferase involved in cell wall biosynthesis
MKGRRRTLAELAIATPYPEGAIMAIARAAEQAGVLSDFYTSFDAAGIIKMAERLPIRLLPFRVRSLLGRRTFPGVEPERIRVVSPLAEGLYLAVRRVPYAEPLALGLMYHTKRRFDKAVSMRLARSRAQIVVGMSPSSALTFTRAHELGRMTVLNFPNSHPAYENRCLHELAGLQNGDNEMIPQWVVREVDREIDSSDLILVPSQLVAAQLKDLGVDPGRIIIEPYGVDLSVFHPSGSEERAGQKDRLVCLYVGHISYLKGIKVLVEAARRLLGQPVEFWLAGPIVSRAVLRDLPENTRYLGKQTHAALPAIMRRADIFVLASLEESYGLVTLEAMACGLPVIVSDHAGTGEFVQDGISGVVVRAGEPADLVEAITRLAQDAEGRRRMGIEGLHRVQAGNSWDDYAARVLNAIDQRFAAVTRSTRKEPG